MIVKMKKTTTLLFCLLLIAAVSCKARKSPDQLVMLLEKNVTSFNPLKGSESSDARMQQLIFNGLTRKNEKFEPVPDLAESFSSTPDYLTWTFKLKPNVKFHNGKVMSSADVKYSFDTLMSKDFVTPKSGDFVKDKVALVTVEAPDASTVIFRCVNPMPGFPNQILPVGIIPAGTVEVQSNLPVGTGPFKFVSFASDQEVQLAAFDEYFGGAPTIKSVRIKIVPDNSTRESEFRKGSADLGINLDLEPITAESLKKEPGVKVLESDGTNLGYLGVNVTDPILKDSKVRQAVAYALDRNALIKDVLLGQAKPASSVLPPSQWAFEAQVAQYNYDPDKARKLLDEAGRKQSGDQARFKLTLKTSVNSVSRKVAEVAQEQLRKVGIELTIQSLEFQKLSQDITDGNYQLFYRTMVGGNQSTDIFKYAYHSKSIPPNGQNRMRYSNPRVDKLIDEALLAPPEKRKEYYSQIQKVLADDLPQIYLWYTAAITVYRDRVSGIVQDPSGDWSVIRNVKLSN